VATADDDLLRKQHLEILRARVGKDLSELEEGQLTAIQAAIDSLVPNRNSERAFGYQPERVWEVHQGEDKRLVVLFERFLYTAHPGASQLRLTVFDDTGRVLAESMFTTGHRCYMRELTLEAPDKGTTLFVLKTGAGGGFGPDIGKQVYALTNGRFDLVRLEDSEGAATRNRYYVRHFTCGPDTAGRTVAEWEADLFSEDRLLVLRALVWLGGWHWDYRPEEKVDRQQEDFAEVQLVREVRSKKAVTTRLTELAKSKDAWIREAAELALKPEDTRF